MLLGQAGDASPLWGVVASLVPQTIGDVAQVAAAKYAAESRQPVGMLRYGSSIGMGVALLASGALLVPRRTRVAGAVGMSIAGIRVVTELIAWSISGTWASRQPQLPQGAR
jgi:hypothetical protein